MRTIKAKLLDPESFAPFGQILEIGTVDVGRSGPGWRSWHLPNRIDADGLLSFGIVHTALRDIDVVEMERHVNTFELLYPHGSALVQPLAAPHDLTDPDAKPRPEDVEAFIILPGQAIVMHRGTWHSPSYPVTGDTTYTYGSVGSGDQAMPVWVPFEDGSRVHVDM